MTKATGATLRKKSLGREDSKKDQKKRSNAVRMNGHADGAGTGVTRGDTAKEDEEEEKDVPQKKAGRGTKRGAAVVANIAQIAGPAKRPRIANPVKAQKTIAAKPNHAPRLLQPQQAPLNLIPAPPAHVRPSPEVFFWGTGETAAGFPLGDGDERGRPTLQPWFSAERQAGRLGGPDASLETLVCGGMHTLAIDEAGRVITWGCNDDGALGRATVAVPDPTQPGGILHRETLEMTPTLLQDIFDSGFRAVSLSAGDSVTVLIGADGTLLCCGAFRGPAGLIGFDPDHAQAKEAQDQIQRTPIPLPELQQIEFVFSDCGNNHVLALTSDGYVYNWGDGALGSLARKGTPRRPYTELVPQRMSLKNIRTLGCGAYHSFAVDKDGMVYAWGLNSTRQCGIDFKRRRVDDIVWKPTKVDALSPDRLGGERVIQIAAGDAHTLFLISDGRVYGCGRSDEGELGIDPGEVPSGEKAYVPIPTLITFPSPPAADDPNPQLIDGEAPAPNPIASISVSCRTSSAISRAGYLYTFGVGLSCQLGLGSNTEMAMRPTLVRWTGWTGSAVKAASLGGQHGFLLAAPRPPVP